MNPGAAELALALASADAGAAPVPGSAEAPLPGGMGAAPPGGDPLMAALMGAGGPPPMDPMMGGGGMGGIPPELMALMGGAGAPPAGPMYPTTNPDMMAQALSQILSAQQMDHSAMAMDQQAALTGNPVFQALVSGAPMGPGAGQDGQAIGAPTGDMPMPEPGMASPY